MLRLLGQKAFRVLVVVTSDTIFPCLFLSYFPDVFLVTIKTLQIHGVNMQIVLAYAQDSAVASHKAVSGIRLYLFVRIMAVITDELHWQFFRHLYLR